MELAQGGSLLDYVRQRKRLAEPEACFFLQQIVLGLMHCHDMEVRPSQAQLLAWLCIDDFKFGDEVCALLTCYESTHALPASCC